MYYDFKIKIRDIKDKIYEKTIKDSVYINYEYDRVYKPDKKYNIPKRTTIEKKCDDDPTMMYHSCRDDSSSSKTGNRSKYQYR